MSQKHCGLKVRGSFFALKMATVMASKLQWNWAICSLDENTHMHMCPYTCLKRQREHIKDKARMAMLAVSVDVTHFGKI